MIVYQESYDVHNTLERRLFLNGKTYVEINPYSEEKKMHLEDTENDLPHQLYRDYEHYPEDLENGFFDFAGYGLRYGFTIDQTLYLYPEGGRDPATATKELYELEQQTFVADGAIPLTPAKEIPEMADVRYRVAYHHDGMVEKIHYQPYEELEHRS